MSRKSIEYNLSKGAGGGAFGKAGSENPYTTTWGQFTDERRQVIGGSPDTVVAQIEDAVKSLRIGHLMVILQLQSMDRELTEYNTRLFAEKVLPRIRHLWDKEGHIDHWWPQGATRQAPAASPALETAK
jgi:hypothetical protein